MTSHRAARAKRSKDPQGINPDSARAVHLKGSEKTWQLDLLRLAGPPRSTSRVCIRVCGFACFPSYLMVSGTELYHTEQ